MSDGVDQEGRVPRVEDAYEETPEQKGQPEALAAEQGTESVQPEGDAETDRRAPPLDPAIRRIAMDVLRPPLEVDVERMAGPAQVRPPPAGGRGMRISRPIRQGVVLAVEGDPGDRTCLGGRGSEACQRQLE